MRADIDPSRSVASGLTIDDAARLFHLTRGASGPTSASGRRGGTLPAGELAFLCMTSGGADASGGGGGAAASLCPNCAEQLVAVDDTLDF